MAHQSTQCGVVGQQVIDHIVLGVIANIADELHGQRALVVIDGVGPVGDIVDHAVEHIDVVLADVDPQ